MSEMAYTSRQINSLSTSLQYFILTVLCEVDQCFDLVEVAYQYDSSTPSKNVLFNATSVIVRNCNCLLTFGIDH